MGLVADDDRDLRELIGFTLTQAGYLVVKAGDGPAALRVFESESPDLVVLDINMPGASGFQVCEAVRKRSRVPVIMLTVRGEEEDLVRALELGADDYLTKPFSPRTLLARIKALLRRAGMENSAPLAVGRVALDPCSLNGRLQGPDLFHDPLIEEVFGVAPQASDFYRGRSLALGNQSLKVTARAVQPACYFIAIEQDFHGYLHKQARDFVSVRKLDALAARCVPNYSRRAFFWF